MRRVLVIVPVAVVSLTACGDPVNRFFGDVRHIISNQDAAYIIGEGVCELLEDGGSESDAVAAVTRLGFNGSHAEEVVAAATTHICDE